MSNFNTDNSAKILSGKEVSPSDLLKISQKIAHVKKLGSRPPCLAVVLVGDRPESLIYVNAKQKACKKAGIDSRVLHLAKDVSQKKLIETIIELNKDASVDGVLIQLPLPAGFNTDSVLDILSPLKDVDGLTPHNLGLLLSKRPAFVPCTPLGCMDLIRHSGIDISGKHAVVLGRSILVGRPMAILLEQANATVSIVHSASQNVQRLCKTADIIVAAIGKPGYVTSDFLKEGAVVIDVGITRIKDKLYGDVHESAIDVAGWLTPVPGGVGPMTITKLLGNTVKAALG